MKEEFTQLENNDLARKIIYDNNLSIRNNLRIINLTYCAYNLPSDNNVFNQRKANFEHRLKSYIYHYQLIVNWLDNSHLEVNRLFKYHSTDGTPFLESMKFSHLQDNMTSQIYSLVDSCIYHQVSSLDYLSSIIQYAFGDKKNYQKTIMWTSLSKASRDRNSVLSKFNFSREVDLSDRLFFSKLYDHRSSLIHKEGDYSGIVVSMDLMSDKISVDFIAPTKLGNKFKELKKLSSTRDLSIEYVINWLALEYQSKVNSILKLVYQDILELNKENHPSITVVSDGESVLPKFQWNEVSYH